MLTATRILTDAKTLLQVEGSGSENIIINAGDTKKASNPILFENGSSKNAVTIRS
jgi:hypothetical protein